MQTRHRVPTVFTLYMVDVLCCALGCVIFLWFLKIHEAKIQERQAARREQEAARTRDDLLKTRVRLDSVSAEVTSTQDDLLKTRARLKSVSAKMASTRDDLLKTRTRLDNVLAEMAGTKDELVKTRARLDHVSAEMTTTQGRLERVSRDMAATQKRLGSAESERDQVRRDRNAALTDLAAVNKEVDDLKARKSAAESDLAQVRRDKGALAKELVGIRQRISKAEVLLLEKEALAMNTARTADELAERLRGADARVKELRPLAESVPGLREEARSYRDKLAALEARARSLEKQIGAGTAALAAAGQGLQKLEDANLRLTRDLAAQTRQLSVAERDMDTLRGDKRTLLDQVGRERAARDNRFAGVALTGRRVVFLVDMSGSMDLVDEQTAAPEKWSGVRQTLTKIMRSLPELEKFQVILFSQKVTYLMNDGAAWLDYKGQASLEQVTRALAAVKPDGNTDMSAALAAAFRFRPAGLDTIYLFSDGLPNVGEGLSDEESAHMTERRRNETLSRYIRQKLLRVWNGKTSDGQPRVRINTIGFFYESPEVGAFLWALARENEGSFVGMSRP